MNIDIEIGRPWEIKFYRTSDPFGCFSNFSKHPIAVDGEIWKTSEHFYQAQKFPPGEHRTAVLNAPSPKDAANIGRDKARPMRPDWDAVKDDIMRLTVYIKLEQHPDVKQLLLSTGDAMIIEHSRNDSYWADGGDGSGKNMLGQILMEHRQRIRSEELSQLDGMSAADRATMRVLQAGNGSGIG